jgi:hypothetical protein
LAPLLEQSSHPVALSTELSERALQVRRHCVKLAPQLPDLVARVCLDTLRQVARGDGSRRVLQPFEPPHQAARQQVRDQAG